MEQTGNGNQSVAQKQEDTHNMSQFVFWFQTLSWWNASEQQQLQNQITQMLHRPPGILTQLFGCWQVDPSSKDKCAAQQASLKAPQGTLLRKVRWTPHVQMLVEERITRQSFSLDEYYLTWCKTLCLVVCRHFWFTSLMRIHFNVRKVRRYFAFSFGCVVFF